MPAFTPTEQIWMNGRLVPWAEAQTHVMAHGLNYGTGVFEGIRSYDTPHGPAVFRLEDHLQRMSRSATFYELDIPYPIARLVEATLDVVRVNGQADAYLRPLAFFDAHTLGVVPAGSPVTVVIGAIPFRTYLAGADTGVRVTVSPIRRVDATTLPPTVKACGHYTNSVRAVQEAVRRGFDEAILLNSKGDVAEGSGENLFLVKNGTLITNGEDASILMGITRDTVLTLARDLGIPTEIRAITVQDLKGADELFFSGTAVEITPIAEVDGYTVPAPGPVTARLRSLFFDVVRGKRPEYRHWLAPVNQPVQQA